VAPGATGALACAAWDAGLWPAGGAAGLAAGGATWASTGVAAMVSAAAKIVILCMLFVLGERCDGAEEGNDDCWREQAGWGWPEISDDG
jgi:hypothetical protein